MPDQERYDRTIALIDGALEYGDTGPDSMRWRPHTQAEPRTAMQHLHSHGVHVMTTDRDRWCRLEVELVQMMGGDPAVVEAGSVTVAWSEEVGGPGSAWIDWTEFEPGPTGLLRHVVRHQLDGAQVARMADITRRLNDTAPNPVNTVS